jgi:hypothetical protein
MREVQLAARKPGPVLHRLISAAQRLNATGRVVAWLVMFIFAYRLGLPVLYAAALAGLPLLLLPPASSALPPSGGR